jgi:hypothetical protein
MAELATVRTYDELLAALRARTDELQITRDTIDAVGGLPDRYAVKLLCPHPIKIMGRVGPHALISLHAELTG